MCESVSVWPMYGMCVMCLCSCMVGIYTGIAKCEVLDQSPSLVLHMFVQTYREHKHMWVCPLCAVCTHSYVCLPLNLVLYSSGQRVTAELSHTLPVPVH